jgi:hypothetical protein
LAHYVRSICLITDQGKDRLFVLLCFYPPLESSCELWLAWGKGMAREQGKPILGSQLAHFEVSARGMAMGNCCYVGELRPWRQELNVASGRRWAVIQHRG